MFKLFIQQTGLLRHALILLAVVLFAILSDQLAGCSVAFITTDALLFALLTTGMALAIWNILRYTLKTEGEAGRLGLLIVGLCIVWCLIGISIECTVMLFISEGWFQMFSALIPLRMIAMFLIFMVAELNTERVLLLKQLISTEDSEDSTSEKADATSIHSQDSQTERARILTQGSQSEKNNSQSQIDNNQSEEQVPQIEVLSQVSIKSGQRLDIVNIEDIIFLQADGDYVSIVTENGHYLKEQTMKYFEERLPQEMFARVHRSFIVRLSAISRIERYGQMQQLELCNKEKIRVSPAGYRILKEKLKL